MSASTEIPKIQYTKIFINNEFVDAINGKTFPSLNPATGEKLADIAEGEKDDIDIAVKAAKQAFSRKSEWRKLAPSERGRLLNKLADLIEQHTTELAALETLDNGKPFKCSVTGDIPGVVAVFRYYAGLCDKFFGKTLPIDGDFLCMTRKEPIGVVGQIIPWNYPLMMVAWKWGPALAAGCTLVLKPAEQTPLTALYVAALSKEAGFPKGVINVVPGYGPTAGAALALHPDVEKIAFTGSTEIGKKMLAYSAQSNMKKVSLELGGKSPLVVFDDADVDEAVEIAHDALFSNHGQNCCAGSRTFVQAKIYDEFVKKATEVAKKRIVGDPFSADTEQGPQVDKPSIEKIMDLISSGVSEGAKLQTGGKSIGHVGYFVEPTVFSDVKDNMRIAKEEIFGPVQSILKFETMDEVIERANSTEYGLAAGVVTKDINRAIEFSQAVRAGSVWVNTYNAVSPQVPFGGYKMSGIGRELGPDSLEGYLETKTITISVPCNH
ncbi:aldehyde dehydrogenase [Coccinella septempunctata]|uniref:aldehyde dehydrogenase n=1 Tax=Coccinella septempunctata TaxID=41139 RepID=UPI001D098AEB|nr:aldehyde dehydrogenase [Coccinella septempunctata]